MPAVKRPVIPANEAELPGWMCQHTDHVEEYVAVEGQRWVNVAERWVFQVFGSSDQRLANEIAWAALSHLCTCARDGRLKTIRSFRPWFNGVLKNMARDARWGHVRRSRSLEIDPEQMLQAAEEPLDPEESAIVIQKIEECMQGLASVEQRVLRSMMVDPDNPPEPKDIAVTLGMSSGSVRNQLSTGRAKLEECLKRKGVLK